MNEILALLCRRFPRTFFASEALRRPLKIGIFHDLVVVLGDAVSRKRLRLALWLYTHSDGYLAQVKRVGAKRVGLNGKAAGCVNAEEAKRAKAAILAK